MFWIPPFIQCIQQALDLHWALEASLHETLHRSTYLNTNPSNPLQYTHVHLNSHVFFSVSIYSSPNSLQACKQSHNSLKSPFIFLLLRILPWLSLYFCIYFQKANSLQLYLGKNKNVSLVRTEFLPIVSWQKLRKHSCISRFLQQSQKPVELYIFAHLRFSFMINMINPSQSNFISSSSVLFIDQLFYCFTRVHLLYERYR